MRRHPDQVTKYASFADVAEELAKIGPVTASPTRIRERLGSRIAVGGREFRVEAAHLARGSNALVVILVTEAALDSQPAAATGPEIATAGLTRRELQITSLLAERRTNREIAMILDISLNTARNHVQRILTKLGVRSRRKVPGALVHRTVYNRTE